ncbi:MAG: hypothetical protein ACLP5V_07520 [Candidatus Bathyarchaeia archaeon]
MKPTLNPQGQVGGAPVQMVVFAIVTMIYIPCIATIAALVREFGAKRAIAAAVLDSLLAIFLGGLAYRVLPLAF